MPIRINLLADAQAAEEERRKDPVKRGVLAGVFLVFLVLLWSSSIQLKLMTARSNLGSLEAKWKSIEKSYESAAASQRQVGEAKKKLAALNRLTAERFLWGTALNALQQTLNGVEDVQVIRVKTDQTFVTEEVKGKAPEKGRTTGKAKAEANTEARTEAKGKGESKSKTLVSTEKTTLTIEAMDSSRSPQGQVTKYKETLASLPYFKTSLHQTNGVMLTSLSAPQVGAGRNAFVTFTLQCLFPEKVRRND